MAEEQQGLHGKLVPRPPDASPDKIHRLNPVTMHTASLLKNQNRYELPPEVIFQIAEFLSPISLLAWSYTCRFFLRTLDTSTIRARFKFYQEHLRLRNYNGRSSSRAAETVFALHLELLYLLDKDDFLSPAKAICSGCANTHNKSMFSLRSLEQPNTTRICLGITGSCWICPHVALSYRQINTQSSSSLAQRARSERCDSCHINVRIGISRSTMNFPILTISSCYEEDLNELAAQALSELNLEICAHASLRDATLPNLNYSDCSFMTSVLGVRFCDCSPCLTFKKSGECLACGSTVRFHLKSCCGSHTLWVTIRKAYDASGRCSQRWRDQAVQPDDFEPLTKSWKQTVDYVEQIENMNPCSHYSRRRCSSEHGLYDDKDWLATLTREDEEHGFWRLPPRTARGSIVGPSAAGPSANVSQGVIPYRIR